MGVCVCVGGGGGGEGAGGGRLGEGSVILWGKVCNAIADRGGSAQSTQTLPVTRENGAATHSCIAECRCRWQFLPQLYILVAAVCLFAVAKSTLCNDNFISA